jgi:hypothetical protein
MLFYPYGEIFESKWKKVEELNESGKLCEVIKKSKEGINPHRSKSKDGVIVVYTPDYKNTGTSTG